MENNKNENLKDNILNDFKSGKLVFKTLSEICFFCKRKGTFAKDVKAAVAELEDDGLIIKDGSGAYATPEQFGAFKGTISGNAQGFAFITPEDRSDGRKDYFVPRRRLGGALNKDVVLAFPVRGTEDEATVVKILERGTKTVVGRFEKDKRAGYVIPDDSCFDSDVYVPLHLCGKAKVGNKVVAEITSYPKDKMVGGKIIEILGEDGDFYTEELAIIRSYNLREEFPDEVEEAAKEVAGERISLKGRKDLRSLLTVTIDGDDTRDIDDAISLSYKGGKYLLGVHIADVSHYVRLGETIDKEAYARGTSVYFPDRVLPMLPRSLSNGACSLNEGEDRYALSCLMTINKKGEVIASEICESVIKSDKRMTYNEVTSILNGERKGDGRYKLIAPMLEKMKELCLILENRRKNNGSVNLDVKEAHIYVDEDGEIVIPDYERTLSHRIIEQFMVTANETVARFAEKRKAPFLYRVHEKPAPEKAATFFSFLRDLGVHAKGKTEDIAPADFAKILSDVEGAPYASVVNRVMLRSMQKARYSEENLGHFGLASECYCHFTSPIRRYPDLFVHRVLKKLIQGKDGEAKKLYSPIAKEAASDTSERERTADLAERDVDDLYKVVYMSERIGEEYDAVISGVIASGIFAELPNTVEGMIRYESLPRDNYEFYEDKFLLKGTRRSFRIGDEVRVKVAGCDFGSMRVQFVLA